MMSSPFPYVYHCCCCWEKFTFGVLKEKKKEGVKLRGGGGGS